jgi:2,4-dienoyl-CoA reductase (NADPH2)
MLEHLFQPFKIGKFEIRNRVKYAACSVSNFNNLDGTVSERELARMKVIAKTGCGIITNQGAFPDSTKEGKGYYRQLAIYDDRFIPGLKKIADLIHAENAVAIQQILHAGRYGGVDTGYALQPSNVPQRLRHYRPVREMTKEEIKRVVQDHAEAARRAIDAGFDGVEITAFQGYILANFLSPFTNKRTDEYGGDIENRCRFMVETIDAIRDKIGEEKILSIRLNGTELLDDVGGSTEEECIEYMKIAEKAGVDIISIVVGWHESSTGALGRDLPSDRWLYLAENAKKHLKVPIAFGPRFGDPKLADKAIKDGIIDLWEICRPALADPEIVHKAKEGRFEEIKPCLGGLMCLSTMFHNLPYICTVNPRLGHEVEPEYEVRPAVRKKRIAIIGGGVAGLECAITAAKRGHEVVLFEKEDKLGGQLIPASKEVGGGTVFLDLIRYYEVQLRKLGVEVKLNTEANAKLIAGNFDVAVIATGAVVDKAALPAFSVPTYTATEVLRDRAETGDNILVISGERAGLVAAEYLASQGKRVTIVEEGRRVAKDVIPTFKWRHKLWLKEFNISVLTESRVSKVENGIAFVETPGGVKEVKVDCIIVGGPRKPLNQLWNDLEFAVDEKYLIGDAVVPRNIAHAIHEGYKLGVRL